MIHMGINVSNDGMMVRPVRPKSRLARQRGAEKMHRSQRSRSILTLDRAVIEHYRHGALENVLLNALAAAGKDLDNLTADDLAPADEFYVGGRQATIDFATGLGSAGHPAGGAGIRHNAAAKIAETSWIGA